MSCDAYDLTTYLQTRTLYVILQGEFALYHEVKKDNESCDTLHIMAPYVQGHRYLAGPWLTDWKNAAELPRKLCLKNAFGDQKQGNGQHCGRAIPEQNADIFFKLGEETLNPEKARVHIEAPMPLAILPGLTQTTSSVSITVNSHGTTSHPPLPARPTVIPILVYKWYDGSRPYLVDEEDDTYTWPSGGPSDDFQNIHFYATSADKTEEDNEAHAKHAFREAAALLGVDAHIDWDSKDQFPRNFATPPAGLSWAQVNLFLYAVTRFKTNDRRLILDNLQKIATPGLEPFDLEHIMSGDTGDCGPVTG